MIKTFLFLIGLLLLAQSVSAQKIFSCNYPRQADIKVFVAEYPRQADLKIHFVKYESQAGWRNASKKHLLY